MSAATRRRTTQMYAVEDTLPVEELAPGTYFVVGPPLTRKSELLGDLLVAGSAREEGAVFVSTSTGVESLHRRFGWDLGDRPEHFAVIDCISRQSGAPAVEAEHTSYVSSPGDLTGVGMYLNGHLDRLTERGVDRVRVALDSVSTLLMYEDYETVFRFLHVMKNRLNLAEALGAVAINTETHDDERVRAILGLADGLIEVRESEADGADGDEVRVVLDEETTDWRPL